MAGSSPRLSNKQQPPPQQTFPISLVSTPLNGDRILRRSSGLDDINMVDARLLLGDVGWATRAWSSPGLFGPAMSSSLFSIASSTCESVAGVPGASYSEPEVYAMDGADELGDASRCGGFLDFLGMAIGLVGAGSSE